MNGEGEEYCDEAMDEIKDALQYVFMRPHGRGGSGSGGGGGGGSGGHGGSGSSSTSSGGDEECVLWNGRPLVPTTGAWWTAQSGVGEMRHAVVGGGENGGEDASDGAVDGAVDGGSLERFGKSKLEEVGGGGYNAQQHVQGGGETDGGGGTLSTSGTSGERVPIVASLCGSLLAASSESTGDNGGRGGAAAGARVGGRLCPPKRASPHHGCHVYRR